MKTETGNDIVLLGDFVEFGNRPDRMNTGMIIGLAKDSPQLTERVFQVKVVGGMATLPDIVEIPYKEFLRLDDKSQEACKLNYSRLVLGYTKKRERDELRKRDDIMVAALAEIKAKFEGNPEQKMSIGELIEACIEELKAVAQAEGK